METVTIQHKETGRETQIFPTPATIARFESQGWNCSAAKKTQPKPAKKVASKSADIRRLEMEVSEKLGARVSLDHSSKGAGRLVISYNSLDELDGILKHIK